LYNNLKTESQIYKHTDKDTGDTEMTIVKRHEDDQLTGQNMQSGYLTCTLQNNVANWILFPYVVESHNETKFFKFMHHLMTLSVT
jgi:hypothetical protein